MYLRLDEELHQIAYERSVGQPFLASLCSNTCNCLFIWHKQAFIQEFASCLGDSSVRWIHQLVHMLAVFVCEDISVMPSKRSVCQVQNELQVSTGESQNTNISVMSDRRSTHYLHYYGLHFHIFLSWSLRAGIRQESHKKHTIWTIHLTVRS